VQDVEESGGRGPKGQRHGIPRRPDLVRPVCSPEPELLVHGLEPFDGFGGDIADEAVALFYFILFFGQAQDNKLARKDG